MKKIGLFYLIIAVFICPALAYAQTDQEGEETQLPPSIDELPPGMEVIKVGSANIIAPKGSKVSKKGTVLTIETIEQFAARRFQDTDNRLSQIEIKQEGLKTSIGKLKKSIGNITGNQLNKIGEEQKNLKSQIMQLKETQDDTTASIERRLAKIEKSQKDLKGQIAILTKSIENIKVGPKKEEVKPEIRKRQSAETEFYYEYGPDEAVEY